MRLISLLAALLLGGPALAGGNTTTAVPSLGTTNVAGFVCFTTQFCTAHVIIDNTGTEKGTSANPFTVNGTGAGNAVPVTGTFWQATQPVSGTVSVTGTVTTTAGGVAQGSTTSGQSGNLTQAAVVSGAPSYTNGQTSPLTMTLGGALNVAAASSQLMTTGSTAPGIDPGMGLAVLCQNGAGPTVSAGQTVAFQCAGDGTLKTTAGGVAQGAAISGLSGPMMQGLFSTTAPAYADGTVNPGRTDAAGNWMVNVAAGSAANSAASATGSAVPANAGYTGVNVGGTQTGWTATTVGGKVGGDINLNTIAGVAPPIGAGVESTALRVTLPSNGTGQVGINPAANTVTPVLATTGGWTPFLLNQQGATKKEVKATAGQIGVVYCYNPNTTVEYIQFFDSPAASVTVGSTTPVQSYGIPPAQNGGLPLPVQGLQFNAGITIAVTTGATNGSGPTTPVDCNVGFN